MVADPPVDPGDAGISPSPAPTPSDAALARRAQILATEHWGLLAARGTAQSEVLTRITIYLTLVSAGLVTIGLLGQVTSFDHWFTGAALAILGFLALVGIMTQTRVFNVAEEDLMYVVAMNRLRGAYVDLDPSVERYFLAGIADDRPGVERTYSFLRRRSFSHLFGSSFILIIVVNACVVGLLAGSSVVAGGGSVGWGIAVGVVVALLLVAGFFVYGNWTYRTAWRNHEPLRRSVEPPLENRTDPDPVPPLTSRRDRRGPGHP
jgi:membrane protein YdbS with pleckstrin-like domain